MIMMHRKGSHSIFNLKYHIIWCTKYRYRVLTKEVAQRTREIIREICASNYVDILSGNVGPDHIHILVSVPPSISISKLMQYIKGKCGRKLLQEFEQLKKRYWRQHVWSRGYFAVTVGNLNDKQVQEYIENQSLHNKEDDFSVSDD